METIRRRDYVTTPGTVTTRAMSIDRSNPQGTLVRQKEGVGTVLHFLFMSLRTILLHYFVSHL